MLFAPSRPMTTSSSVKRAESMKVELGKKLKRTPSFTTRRRAQSFRRSHATAGLPPVEMEGFLDRKHELQAGGKKATIRSWKTFYTVLCGQLLCFFKVSHSLPACLSAISHTTLNTLV